MAMLPQRADILKLLGAFTSKHRPTIAEAASPRSGRVYRPRARGARRPPQPAAPTPGATAPREGVLRNDVRRRVDRHVPGCAGNARPAEAGEQRDHGQQHSNLTSIYRYQITAEVFQVRVGGVDRQSLTSAPTGPPTAEAAKVVVPTRAISSIPLMTAVQQAPSGLDADPSAYLALPRFNNILAFSFDLAGTAYPSTISYALTFAPPAGAWPVLVFFNGLGGHRLVAALFEGIAREHRVQILVLDKPSGPLCQSFAPTAPTTPLPLPLALRTRWAHAALLAVLAHHRIARFAALSHSNGVFYALHTLLHLPPGLTPTGWALTGLFIPPSISGSAALRLAAALPHALPNGLGALLQVVPPLASVAWWSGGVWAASAGLLSAAPAPDDAAHRPPHKRGYLARSVSDACRTATMRVGLREGRAVMGQEALLCLHGAEPAGAHGDAGADGGSDARVKHESVWGVGPGGDDAAVLRGAFARLAERYGGGGGMPVWVTYGAADGMVPAKGRAWLHAELEGVGLLRQGDDAAWTEVPEAGHDDVLFVDAVVGGILGRVARQA